MPPHYLVEDRTPKVAELLTNHCPSDAHSLSWEMLKDNDPFKAAKDGDLAFQRNRLTLHIDS